MTKDVVTIAQEIVNVQKELDAAAKNESAASDAVRNAQVARKNVVKNREVLTEKFNKIKESLFDIL